MKNDFTTAPLAPGLRGAGGGTVEKSFTASHTKIQTRPSAHERPKLEQDLTSLVTALLGHPC